MAERKPLSKRVRFEVFKRDSFTCQYCGAKAPDVLLQIDHIVPVAEGGENDILNLLTACVSCNAGKSARRLSDHSVLERQRDQLEDLQERRNQLEMMLDWQRSLADLDATAVEEAIFFWISLAPSNLVPNDNGRTYLDRLIKKYGLGAVIEAMRTSTKRLVYKDDDSGCVTDDSWDEAFDYVGRVLRIEAASAENPYAKDIAYIIGILKKRVRFINFGVAGQNIGAALSWGITFEEIKSIAATTTSWNQFNHRLCDAIDEAGGEHEE